MGVSIGNFAVTCAPPPSSVLLVRSQGVFIVNIEKMGTENEERKGAGDLRARCSGTAVWCDQVGGGRKGSFYIYIYILL